MKQKIDIEKLVQWALRDEMPKGRPVSDDIGRVIASRHQRKTFAMAMGARPDIDHYGFVPGAPHEDAERVADAVATLNTTWCMADVDYVRVLFGAWLPIAADAVRTVLASTFNPQSLVVRASISGRRPRWQFDQPKPYQRFAPSTGGRPRALVYGTDIAGDLVEMKPNDGRARKRDGLYSLALSPHSPLQWGSPSTIAIGEARAEYGLWHWALGELAHQLAGTLAEYEPVAPAAAALPWLTGERVSRVLSGKVAYAIEDGLPLSPRREISSAPLPNGRASMVRFVARETYAAQPTSKTIAAV